MSGEPGVRIAVPGSKSLTLRHLLAGGLAATPSLLRGALDCDDSRRLAASLRALGAGIRWPAEGGREPDRVAVEGTDGRLPPGPVTLDAGESGAVLRFLMALVAHGRGEYTLLRHGRLPERPVAELAACLPARVNDGQDGRLLITPSAAGERPLRLGALASSQTLSALLLAGPLAAGGRVIEVLGEVPSAGYVDLTIQAMAAHGVAVERQGGRFVVPAGSRYRGAEVAIEGDWSSAAALLVGAVIAGRPVLLSGLARDSLQPDRRIVEILATTGVDLVWTAAGLGLSGRPVRPLEADLDSAPDLAPVLVALAAILPGQSRFTGLGRLADKESDRGRELARGLGALGIAVHRTSDGATMSVSGGALRAARLDAPRDHRIVMALSLLALAEPGIEVGNRAAVSKSFPGFFEAVDLLAGRG